MDVLSSRILLRPSDLDRSRRFYRDLLGLAIYREFGPPDDPGLVFFPGASPRLGLLPEAITGQQGAPFPPSPGVLIASRVRSAWRQQRADGRVAGWSSNAGAARTVTFTDVAFAVQKKTVGRL